MEVIIKPNYEELSKYAAEIISRQIQEKPNSVLGLATGSTPEGLYKEIVRMRKEKALDFSKIVTFNLDEYYGLAIDSKQSYACFMHENLFKHININQENAHIPDGKIPLQEIENYCRQYENKIKENRGIDLQILGIGIDGHIGFNEPGSSLYSRTRLVVLDKTTIDTNWEKFFKKDGIAKENASSFAITMGIGTIFEAGRILLMASGKSKADIVAKFIEGPVTSQVPASFLQLHPNVSVILDEDAASKLQRYEHYKYSMGERKKLERK